MAMIAITTKSSIKVKPQSCLAPHRQLLAFERTLLYIDGFT